MADMTARATQMKKSELIKRMSDKLEQLSNRDVDLAVHTLIEIMSDNLASGGRIEIRGFGTFSNHFPVDLLDCSFSDIGHPNGP